MENPLWGAPRIHGELHKLGFEVARSATRIFPNSRKPTQRPGSIGNARVRPCVSDGIKPSEIGLFVRTRDQLDRARVAVRGAGHEVFELSERGDDPTGQVSIGTMHLAKGLEFKAVAVMACDDEVLPLQARIESVADEVDLDDVYETERQCRRKAKMSALSKVGMSVFSLLVVRFGGCGSDGCGADEQARAESD
jgi:UvrD-like helicase family protein